MGKKIENYVLDTVVGQGQFGKVYRAQNEKTGQTVAIKVIRIEKFKMSPKLQQFTINQIQTLSKIQDTTHIVRFIQILKTVNNYYFVYEFCNGGTLQTLIKQQGRFAQPKAIIFFKDLLKAFRMLIKNNIMHRDIKPSNILLHNGVIKLADFGFCKPLKDARDLAQTMLGSPIYMAPQILKGQVYTMKADIWSLGVVLYQMLYGFCPFEERTIARLINLIEENTITFPSNTRITKRIEDLLCKMLIKDQFKRITWDQLFQYELNSFDQNQIKKNPFRKKNYNSTNEDSNNKNCNKFINETQNYLSVKDQNKTRKIHQNIIADQQRKIVYSLIQNRSNVLKGVKMIQQFLKQSNSKLTVHVCCFIAQRILKINRQMNENCKKIINNKQNWQYKINSNELTKFNNILLDEIMKIQQKFLPMQIELNNIAQPQDIVYLRYAEEECLTQEKQGLTQLLEIDDFLNCHSKRQYIKSTKKSLLEQYEKRILRHI